MTEIRPRRVPESWFTFPSTPVMVTLPRRIGDGLIIHGILEGFWTTRPVSRNRFEITSFRAELTIPTAAARLNRSEATVFKDITLPFELDRGLRIPEYLAPSFGSPNQGVFDPAERFVSATVCLRAGLTLQERRVTCRAVLRTIGTIGRGGLQIAAGFGLVLNGLLRGTIFCCAGPRQQIPEHEAVKPTAPPADGAPVSGDIKIEGNKPASAEGEVKDGRPTGTVKVKWQLNAPCPPGQLAVKQEIKGYIEQVPVGEGPAVKITARDIVRKNVAGVPPGSSQEVDDIRDNTKPDNSETNFVEDLSSKGSSTYPDDLISKAGKGDGTTDVTLKDDPGTSARVGAVWKEIHVRLTFRTTVFCGNTKIGEFVWHVKYDLPGGTPEVGLGEIK